MFLAYARYLGYPHKNHRNNSNEKKKNRVPLGGHQLGHA